jgi:hypothetical protein
MFTDYIINFDNREKEDTFEKNDSQGICLLQ